MKKISGNLLISDISTSGFMSSSKDTSFSSSSLICGRTIKTREATNFKEPSSEYSTHHEQSATPSHRFSLALIGLPPVFNHEEELESSIYSENYSGLSSNQCEKKDNS